MTSAITAGSLTQLMNLFTPISGLALLLLVCLSGLAAYRKGDLTMRDKKVLFGLIALVVVIPTIFIFGSTAYIYTTAYTNGPVHWHADFRIYINGQHRQLHNPQGLSNRVGTAKFHTHNDNRIHVEGVFMEREDLTLSNFFQSINGELTKKHLSFPSEKGKISVSNTDSKVLKAYVKKGSGESREWKMLKDFPRYVVSPYGTVPPGDIVVLAFGNKTWKQGLHDLKEDGKYGG